MCDLAQAAPHSGAKFVVRGPHARICRCAGLISGAFRQRALGAFAPGAVDLAADPRPAPGCQYPRGGNGLDRSVRAFGRPTLARRGNCLTQFLDGSSARAYNLALIVSVPAGASHANTFHT